MPNKPKVDNQLGAPMSWIEFMMTVRTLRIIHGGSITCGGRTYQRNKDEGGARKSKHLARFNDMAVDLVLDNDNKQNRDAFCKDARKCGMLAKDETDHIHLQGLPLGESKWYTNN